MVLYTCGQKTHGPGFAHPCAKAGKALDAAGYEYEIKTVGGYRLRPGPGAAAAAIARRSSASAAPTRCRSSCSTTAR